MPNVVDGTRLIWNAAEGEWDAYTPVGNTDLAWIAAPDKGTIFNSVGTDATVPLVDGTNAGLMSPGQRATLNTAVQPADLSNYVPLGSWASIPALT